MRERKRLQGSASQAAGSLPAWRKQGNNPHRMKERYKTPRKNLGE